jgi:predicted RNA binding protein YcfA (HicA-like mRNA interferase family)
VARVAEKLGFEFRRQTGSHAIIADLKITVEEFRSLLQEGPPV